MQVSTASVSLFVRKPLELPTLDHLISWQICGVLSVLGHFRANFRCGLKHDVCKINCRHHHLILIHSHSTQHGNPILKCVCKRFVKARPQTCLLKIGLNITAPIAVEWIGINIPLKFFRPLLHVSEDLVYQLYVGSLPEIMLGTLQECPTFSCGELLSEFFHHTICCVLNKESAQIFTLSIYIMIWFDKIPDVSR